MRELTVVYGNGDALYRFGQVRAINKSAPKSSSANSNHIHAVKGGKAVVLKGKRRAGTKGAATSKGTIMEQNEDGLEYSDEGEQEDLQQAMDSYSSATLGKVRIANTAALAVIEGVAVFPRFSQ